MAGLLADKGKAQLQAYSPTLGVCLLSLSQDCILFRKVGVSDEMLSILATPRSPAFPNPTGQQSVTTLKADPEHIEHLGLKAGLNQAVCFNSTNGTACTDDAVVLLDWSATIPMEHTLDGGVQSEHAYCYFCNSMVHHVWHDCKQNTKL